MIERVKISALAKQQLITLKRRTGIEHYNVLCRHALFTSLQNSAAAPTENIQFANGIEIDWKVFAGDACETYLNLLAVRSLKDHGTCDADSVRRVLTSHLHRGLSYLASKPDALIM
jgi:DNA sulfur modification protein DndE